MRNILSIIILGGIVQACSSSSVMNEEQKDYCQYVNTLIGTAENGHTYPGATSPFGLIQASPEKQEMTGGNIVQDLIYLTIPL